MKKYNKKVCIKAGHSWENRRYCKKCGIPRFVRIKPKEVWLGEESIL